MNKILGKLAGWTSKNFLNWLMLFLGQFILFWLQFRYCHDRLSLGLGQLMRLFPWFLVSILYRNRTQYVTFQKSRKTYIFIIWEIENRTNPMWFCVSPNLRLPFTLSKRLKLVLKYFKNYLDTSPSYNPELRSFLFRNN